MSAVLHRVGSARPRTLAALLGAVLAVVLLVWAVAFSPLLGVRTVRVRGEQTITVAEVLSAAHVPHGAALVRLDTAAIRHRVEQIPEVASARVTVSYPSTVVITVTERRPVGYLSVVGGYLLIDATGDEFRTVLTVPAHLPRFELPSGSGTAIGQALATVAGALPPTVLAKLSAIQATSASGITLVLTDGRTVFWG